MVLNKSQKAATLLYAIGMLAVFFVLTPWSDHRGSEEVNYGTYFAVESKYFVRYKAFYAEMAVLTFLYILALVYLKTPKNGRNK
jgi:hypothetical protein